MLCLYYLINYGKVEQTMQAYTIIKYATFLSNVGQMQL